MAIYPKSVAALLAAVRLAKRDPNARFSGPGIWPDLRSTDILRLWRQGVDRRASRGLPQYAGHEWQRFDDLQWDARRINEYACRIRHSGCRNLLRTPRMKVRYPHIDNQAWPD